MVRLGLPPVSVGPALSELGKDAREASRGFWGLLADQILAPWDWRAARRRGNGASRATAVVAPAARSSLLSGASEPSARQCGTKRYCRQMSSCEEAMFYLRDCGLTGIDGDSDGIPSEKLCR
ncbi:excalibur calcium-binding domain-containing protein [Polymorphobacter sp.]|uniref:excalibur calcium-binding domain-containing protein n=1 Tax=Polymorphobacter sp. TaxID=1909290 RepID=UPI003F6E887A